MRIGSLSWWITLICVFSRLAVANETGTEETGRTCVLTVRNALVTAPEAIVVRVNSNKPGTGVVHVTPENPGNPWPSSDHWAAVSAETPIVRPPGHYYLTADFFDRDPMIKETLWTCRTNTVVVEVKAQDSATH